MSSISIERHVAAASATRSGNRQRRLNAVLSGVLVGVVALAPIPLGSNRPFFWALWAAVLGVVAVVYLGLLVLRGESLRVPLGRLWLPALLGAVLAGFLAVQALPMVPGGASFITVAGERIASASLSLAPGMTWLTLLQFVTYGLFFFLMLQVAANRSRARRIAVALFVVVVAHALYGLVALVLLDDSLLFFSKWAYAGFATGSFVNRNSFATFLAFGLVLGVLLALRELRDAKAGGRSTAAMLLAATALILATLVATGSRMGLAAGLIGAGLAALMAAGKGEGGRPGRFLLALVPVAAAVAVLVLYGAGTFDRLGSLETDANVRGDLYAQVLGMIAARPWLGYGGGAFEVAYPLFHQAPVSADLVWDKAHSTYLSLWVELGVIVGSIPLLLVAIAGLDALRLYLGRRGDWTAPAAAVAVIAVAAIHSVVDFSLEIEANSLLFLAIIAVGVARRDEAVPEAS